MTTVSEWVAGMLSKVAAAEHGGTSESGGDGALAEFQQAAVSRLVDILERYGGALLADAVGLGKTRVALAAARIIASRQRVAGGRGSIWCVAPSRTVPHWKSTAALLDLALDSVDFVTHAAMSRGRVPDRKPLVIVVDEAHHFRNRGAKRRKTLQAAPDAPLLLATATPVVNGLGDLESLLELLIDEADVRGITGRSLGVAFSQAEEEEFDLTELLREVTVRRLEAPTSDSFGERPRAKLKVVTYQPSREEAWIWQNLEPALGELSYVAVGVEWPKGLFVEHLLRRWESGPDALHETLGELVDYHERWLDAARRGTRLCRSEFREIFGGRVDQMVFPFLLDGSAAGPDLYEMREADRDLVRLRALSARSAAVVAHGGGREGVVARLAREEEKLLVFTSYRRAAEGLFDRVRTALGPRGRVGLVTGATARATGLGRISAAEILRRFAPRASGSTSLRDHETLRVLIATDCLSEGVNLQDCGRVVLADLPYTPVAVEQRVGRLIRPGGPHKEVEVYLPRPDQWSDSLGMRRRLHEKLAEADRAVLAPGDVLRSDAHFRSNPYAVLTALDTLSRTLGPGLLNGPVTAVIEGRRVGRWLVVAFVYADERPRSWIFGVDENGTIRSLERLFPDLCELAYDGRGVKPAAVPEHVEEILARRTTFLEATRLAPSPLALDAPEVRAWRKICGVESPPSDLDELRERLLRRQRASVRMALERLTAPGYPVGPLVRYVRRLPRRGAVSARIELLGALGY